MIHLVIGANYGDEGKGTVVATIAKHSEKPILNVLTNGGSQRAHNIMINDITRYKFQHFGSGSVYGAHNYFWKEFILNPLQFHKEYEEKKTMFEVFNNKIYRHPHCKWSTPYDMMANQIVANITNTGTCGMGIWETTLRYMTSFQVSFDEFICMTKNKKVEYLEAVKRYYNTRLLGMIPSSYIDAWNSPVTMENFIDDCNFMFEHTEVALYDIWDDYKTVIFENGQGILLSDNALDDGATTPSCTGSEHLQNALCGKDYIIHYVTRPYLTKHGGYTFATEKPSYMVVANKQEEWANPYNEWQGEFRYGELDLNDLRERIMTDANGHKFDLHVTHLDEQDRSDEFRKIFYDIQTYSYSSPIIK